MIFNFYYCEQYGIPLCTHTLTVKVNQSHYKPEVPRGFPEVKVPRLRDNGPMAVNLPALSTGRFLPPGNTPGTHFG